MNVWRPHADKFGYLLGSQTISHSIVRNLSVGCASSCGDTSTQTIASTSHMLSNFIHFYSSAFMLSFFHLCGLLILHHLLYSMFCFNNSASIHFYSYLRIYSYHSFYVSHIYFHFYFSHSATFNTRQSLFWFTNFYSLTLNVVIDFIFFYFIVQ